MSKEPTVLKYEKEIVALLLIDPYNDFIYAGAIGTTNEVVDSISSLSWSTKQ